VGKDGKGKGWVGLFYLCLKSRQISQANSLFTSECVSCVSGICGPSWGLAGGFGVRVQH